MLRNMTSVYILNDDKILMLYRIGSRVVEPSWCGIGGHFENHELNDPEACVLRELHEETGLNPNDICILKLKYITLRLKNNEIRQNYFFFADLHKKEFILPECDEGILEWVDIIDVFNRTMPISSTFCLKHYFETGRFNSNQYSGVITKNGIDFAVLEEF